MITSIHHVSLLVTDVDSSLRFYRDVLEIPLSARRPDLGFPGAWLELPGCGLHLLQLDSPDPVTGRPGHAGRDRHVAFAVNDLQEIVTRLERAGIAFTRSRSGRPAIFCRDPDGNGVELLQMDAG